MDINITSQIRVGDTVAYEPCGGDRREGVVIQTDYVSNYPIRVTDPWAENDPWNISKHEIVYVNGALYEPEAF